MANDLAAYFQRLRTAADAEERALERAIQSLDGAERADVRRQNTEFVDAFRQALSDFQRTRPNREQLRTWLEQRIGTSDPGPNIGNAIEQLLTEL